MWWLLRLLVLMTLVLPMLLRRMCMLLLLLLPLTLRKLVLFLAGRELLAAVASGGGAG